MSACAIYGREDLESVIESEKLLAVAELIKFPWKDSHEASHEASHYEDFKYVVKERHDKMQYM